jgi:hypothetical protein
MPLQASSPVVASYFIIHMYECTMDPTHIALDKKMCGKVFETYTRIQIAAVLNLAGRHLERLQHSMAVVCLSAEVRIETKTM